MLSQNQKINQAQEVLWGEQLSTSLPHSLALLVADALAPAWSGCKCNFSQVIIPHVNIRGLICTCGKNDFKCSFGSKVSYEKFVLKMFAKTPQLLKKKFIEFLDKKNQKSINAKAEAKEYFLND